MARRPLLEDLVRGDLVTVAMLPVSYAGGGGASSALWKTRAPCSGWKGSEDGRPGAAAGEGARLCWSGVEVTELIVTELEQGHGTAWASTAWPRSRLASSGRRAAVWPDSSVCCSETSMELPEEFGLKLQSLSLVIFILSFHPALVRITLCSGF